jgi:hypothetical protein
MVPFVLAALLWLQVQFGALRVLERLPGAWGGVALAAVWVLSALGAWALVSGRLTDRLPWRVLGTPWPAAALLAAVAVCALAVYPAVDDRRSTGGGSDADDAVVLVVDQLRDGEDPFALDTYLGNPPTTGPGSVLWAAPWPGRRAYAGAVVVALGLTLAALRRWCGGWEVPSLTALVLATSVAFWEGMAQGTDHLAMACGLAVVATAVWRRLDGRAVAAVAVLAAVVGTWRGAYLHVPLLLGAAVWRRSRRDAVVLAVAGTALALLLHGVLLSWTDGWDAYDPVQQLVVKSDEDLSAFGRGLVAASVITGAVVVLAELRRRRDPDPSVLLLAGLGAPLAGIAVAGALTADDPAAWSEASYLLPTLVLASVVAARSVVESRAG